MTNKYAAQIRDGFIERSEHAETSQDEAYHGTPRLMYGLKVGPRREVLDAFKSDYPDLSYDDWLSTTDALYHGDSYEEKCAGGMMLGYYPHHRKQLPIPQLDEWLDQLAGWAEVDTTCQSVFTPKEMLADWDTWQGFLIELRSDDNINKRRASLVLLTYPIRSSKDKRPYHLMEQQVEVLQHERDKLITKAVSWVLRLAIKHHRDDVEGFVRSHEETLPAIAIREFWKKFETGKK